MAMSLYEPLDPAKKQIRVIHILPKTQPSQDVVVCTMKTMSRTDANATFDALSYSWGDATVTETISINGVGMVIRTNLGNALRHFRKHNIADAVPIWIDALCINQTDIPERNSQVSVMREVYVQAKCVHIWLGGPQLVEKRGMVALRHYRDFVSDVRGYREVWPEPDDVKAEERLQDLETLASNGYWRRTWIVQEAASAEFIIVHGNDEQVEFQRGHTSTSDHRLINLESLISHLYAHTAHAQLARKVGEHFTIIKMAHLSQYIQIPTSLQEPMFVHLYTQLLQRFRTMEATDPRDKVYGMLGLVPEALTIKVDYSLSVRQVYKLFTIRMLDVNRNLEVISTACSGDPDLPSWVPDYRQVSRSPTALVLGLRGSQAGDALGFQYKIGPSDELCCQGITLGKIVEVRRAGTTIKADFFRTIASDQWRDFLRSACSNELELYSLTCGAVVACQGDHHQSLGQFGPDSLSFMYKLEPRAMRGFEFTIERNLESCDVFVTENGFAGIVLKSVVNTGDEMILPAGALSPFCARRWGHSGTNSFQLLAPCFAEHKTFILPATSPGPVVPSLMNGVLTREWVSSEGKASMEAMLGRPLSLQDFEIA